MAILWYELTLKGGRPGYINLSEVDRSFFFKGDMMSDEEIKASVVDEIMSYDEFGELIDEVYPETEPYLLYGPFPEPLEVELTILQFLEFYNDILMIDINGRPTQINPSYVSMIHAKNRFQLGPV